MFKRKNKVHGIICKVCGTEFDAKSENRYESMNENGFSRAMVGISTYESFDCPKCGCQNTVGIRNPKMKE